VGVIDALPHSDLFPLIQSADLVVLPSIYEGFGIVLCECMLLSKPVVATQGGGFEEIIEVNKSGVLVPPGDSLALAFAIHKLTGDPDKRQRIAIAARERIVSKFSAQGVARDYLKIYRHVAQF
jgi:glycosyltransferase involved in cell wall biosynthesis